MKTVCALLVLLTALGAVGQSMTSTKSAKWNTPTIISNFPDVLVSGGNVDAWHPIKGWALSVATSIGGPTLVVTGSPTGEVYSYNDVTRTFTAHPEYGNVHQIAYGGDGNIYALYGKCPGNGVGYNFGRWNGSGFTLLTYCFESFSLSADGGTRVLLTDVNGTLWTGDTAKGGWQYQANAPFPVGSAVAINNTMFIAVKRDASIWSWNGSTLTQMQGAVIAVASGPGVDQIYAIGTDNNPYHWNGSIANWDRIAAPGAMTALAVDSFGAWAVGPTVNNDNLYRLSETGIEWSRTFSGTVTCNVPPPYNQQICPTFNHTATAQIGTKKKLGAVVSATPWTGTGSWGLTAKVHTNDVLDCLENLVTGDCILYANDDAMECSAGASVLDVSDPQLGVDYGVAIDVEKWTSNGGASGPNDNGLAVSAKIGSHISQACQAGSQATCQVLDPLASTLTCPYKDGAGEYYCEALVRDVMERYILGQPSPWVFYMPWVMTSSGGSCIPFVETIPGFAAWGQWWKVPPCQ